jgi:hypothetical protein
MSPGTRSHCRGSSRVHQLEAAHSTFFRGCALTVSLQCVVTLRHEVPYKWDKSEGWEHALKLISTRSVTVDEVAFAAAIWAGLAGAVFLLIQRGHLRLQHVS